MRQLSQMRFGPSMVCALVVLALSLAGCEARSQFDTKQLQAEFATAAPALKQTAEGVLAALKGADYNRAADLLNGLSRQADLNKAQRQAVRGVLDQLAPYVPPSKTIPLP